MRNSDQQVTGIRVLDISEEGPKAIEAMFNQVIEEINIQETSIIDVQITDNHCFLLLGENKNKQIATILKIVIDCSFRIGNDKYTQENNP